MQDFYTEERRSWFAVVLASFEVSKYEKMPYYCTDVMKNIYSYTLYDEKEHTLENAAAAGKLTLLKYLFETGSRPQYNFYENGEELSLLCIAAKYGHLEVVKYLCEFFRDEDAVLLAAEYGHLKILKYLKEIGYDLFISDNYAISIAIDRGHVDVLQYFMSIGDEYLSLLRYN